MPLQPGEMSMHHVCLVHSSRPNRGAERRMGFSIAYMGPHVRQTTELKATAMLMRGEDRYGHYPLDERPPVTVDDPEKCGDAIEQALRIDGPVLVEAVVDPHEPPMPPKATLDQTRRFAEALIKGTPNREKIVATVVSDKVRELL